MKRSSMFACAAFLAAMGFAAPMRAQGTVTGTLYALSSPPSEFTWGCFGPCACPVMIRSPLDGSFVLRFSHADPLYNYYDVASVNWEVPDIVAPIGIAGDGSYRIGGEVALVQQLTLDLSFNHGPAQHFDSGLEPVGAAFPAISTGISLHAGFCLDTVIVVEAKPLGTAGVAGPSATPWLAVAPNPFAARSRIAFDLPRAGPVDVDVIDLAGRRVRTLAHREWRDAGAQSLIWDGRLESGVDAPPGLYRVRLVTATHRVTRSIVKL